MLKRQLAQIARLQEETAGWPIEQLAERIAFELEILVQRIEHEEQLNGPRANDVVTTARLNPPSAQAKP